MYSHHVMAEKFCLPQERFEEVTELTGISSTLHDLRRIFITIAESLDMSSYAVKRL